MLGHSEDLHHIEVAVDDDLLPEPASFLEVLAKEDRDMGVYLQFTVLLEL